MEKTKKLSKWKSKNIYWHKVIFVDLDRIKKDKLMQRPYKLGQIVGLANIEKFYQTFDEKSKDITPYIVFKYLGKTLYSDNYKQRCENFKEFKKQLKSEEDRHGIPKFDKMVKKMIIKKYKENKDEKSRSRKIIL